MFENKKKKTQTSELIDDLKAISKHLTIDFLEKLEQLQRHQLLSLNDFIAMFSKTLDNTILSKEKKESLDYQAGNIILRTTSDRKMQFKADLYYQNSEGSWFQKQIESPLMDIDVYLNQMAAEELLIAQEMKFAVTKPVTES